MLFRSDEPPFFLRRSSSSDTPAEGHERRNNLGIPASTHMPHRPGMMRMPTDTSSTEDFRSVIDDLTVANKKLKQRLKRYEKLHDSHLQEEKLFEVRFHTLPDHKKKELEETLRKFAASLDDLPTEAPNATRSLQRPTESGYMSMAGPHSTSAPSGQSSDRRHVSLSQYNQQQQNVQSYLHNIPAGLNPTHQPPMTEHAKKKLVVRRLEQVFAGKGSNPGSQIGRAHV